MGGPYNKNEYVGIYVYMHIHIYTYLNAPHLRKLPQNVSAQERGHVDVLCKGTRSGHGIHILGFQVRSSSALAPEETQDVNDAYKLGYYVAYGDY